MKHLSFNIRNTYFNVGGHQNAGRIGDSPGSLISALLPNIIIAVGLIFLVMIVFAGFKMVVGAGQNQSAQDAAKARSALTWSVVGFLIVVMAYFILEIVGRSLGIDFTNDWTANL